MVGAQAAQALDANIKYGISSLGVGLRSGRYLSQHITDRRF